nr:MAG TPA: hypothetical protein [Caudoviricetes sp.]
MYFFFYCHHTFFGFPCVDLKLTRFFLINMSNTTTYSNFCQVFF